MKVGFIRSKYYNIVRVAEVVLYPLLFLYPMVEVGLKEVIDIFV